MANKKTTIEDLAVITANGFKAVDKRFDAIESDMKSGFKHADERLDRIENLLLRDQLQRIEKLEDAVLRLKVKAGVR